MKALFKRGNALRTILSILFLILLATIFFPFVTPLLLAAIFALGLDPIIDKICHRLKLKRNLCIILFLGIVGLTFGAVFIYASFRVYDLTLGDDRQNTIDLLKGLYGWFQAKTSLVVTKINPMLKASGINNGLTLEKGAGRTAETMGNGLLAFTGQAIGSMPTLLMNMFVFYASLLLLSLNSSMIRSLITKFEISTKTEMDQLTKAFQQASYSTILINVLIGVLQATIITTGSLFAGFTEWPLIFLCIFICSFLPVIGSAPVTLVLALLDLASNNSGGAIFMIVIFVIAGAIDNGVRPFLVSRSEKNLHPIISLIALIGAVNIFGFAGLFYGPFITVIAMNLAAKEVQQIFSKTPTPEK